MRWIVPLLICSLMLFSSPLLAKVVEAQGSAAIKHDATGQARSAAIQDAIRQALTQTQAKVDSASMINSNGLVVDSARVSAAGLVKDVVVLKEWAVENIYFVRIRAQVVEEKMRKPSNAARLRKKVAVSQFDIIDRKQSHDLRYIEHDLPRELLRRIENTGKILAVDGVDYLLPERMDYTLAGREVSYSESVSHLANKLNAQFVITGTIRDLGIDYGLLLNSRRIELDVHVIDGISGAVISRHRINEVVRGADALPRGVAFGSAEFIRTEYGRYFDVVLDRLASRILEDLSVLPFSARVVRVQDTLVYFDAGATSLIGVGDTLMGYQVGNQALYSNRGEKFMGYQENPMLTLVVTQVQPQFAVAELEASEEVTLSAGDIVRFGW